MFDLEEAVTVAVKIREKALEATTMPHVAKGLDYAAPTSTQFYRRMVAARLFGLLSTPKASLTQSALDYLKPRDQQTKAMVLRKAILGVTAYKQLVDRYAGKKLNLDLVANGIETDYSRPITGLPGLAPFYARRRSSRRFGLPGCSRQMARSRCWARPKRRNQNSPRRHRQHQPSNRLPFTRQPPMCRTCNSIRFSWTRPRPERLRLPGL